MQLNGFEYDVHQSSRRFLIPRLNSAGVRFRPTPYERTVPRHMPTLQSLNTIWNVANFAEARSPWAAERFIMPRPHVPNVVDLPIKFPGTDYRVPSEFADAVPLLKRMASIEHAANRDVDNAFAYLTADLRPVAAGKTQRHAGAHVDGFQGARISPKLIIDHSIIISDCVPTVFHEQGFDVSGLDERYDDYFAAFDSQLDPQKARTYPPFTLLFMDAYVVHSAGVAEQDTDRFFMRLSYSARPFDRRGNGHNPMFDYSWDMVDRNFRGGH